MPWTLRMTLLVTAITAVCFFYNWIRIYWYSKQTALYTSRRYWLVTGSTATVIFAYPFSGWFLHAITGSFSREWYPVWVIALFWYGFIWNAVLLSWILAVDIFNMIATYIFRLKRPQFQTLLGLTVLVITATVFIYTAAKTVYDTNRVKVETITLEHPAVGAGELDPFRIVHISEMHADRYTSPEKIERYMNVVKAQNPDIVFFTGDLISSGMKYVEPAAVALATVSPPLGVYAVMGDHDYWTGQDEITEMLEQRGVNVVRDASEWVDLNGSTLKVTGVTDVYSTAIDRELLRELLADQRDEQFRLLFSHQAKEDLIEIAIEYDTDLLLAGHTHGGQVRIPFFFKMLTAASEETDYVIGHWKLDDMLLNINSGLGFTLGPLRYNAPAEVSVIELK